MRNITTSFPLFNNRYTSKRKEKLVYAMFLKWPTSGQLILGQPKATLGFTEVSGNFIFTVSLNCWLGYPDQTVAFNFTESLRYVPVINHKSNFKMNFINDDVWPTPMKIFFHFPPKWLIKQLHYLHAYLCKIFFSYSMLFRFTVCIW